jgi:hypothetical protein
MDLLERAKVLLSDSGATFVAVKEGEEHISNDKGIAPILKILDETPDFLKGAYVADKVIGKAAALLLQYAGVERLYAKTLSKLAVQVLDDSYMTYEYDQLVPNIINRTGDGMCPMEQKVLEISDPTEAYKLLSGK